MNDPKAAVVQKHEAIEQLKTNRRHNEETHGSDTITMIRQEGFPGLTIRPVPSLDHVFCDRRFASRHAKFQEFTMNAGRTPQYVFPTDAADQLNRFAVDPWSSAAIS